MSLSIVNDPQRETSQQLAERFTSERVLERLQTVTAESDDDLVKLGMLPLASQAAADPEWPAVIVAEVTAIEQRIQDTHGVPLRFIFWVATGGSVEDKSMYNAAGLLRGGPRLYALDSTDPAKLKAIVEDLQRRTSEPLAGILKATLVVAMDTGSASFEDVVNLERLASLYDKFGIERESNFLELPPDDGRHSAPVTRSSLYPLAFSGVDLAPWIAGAVLTEEQIQTAWSLAAFLHSQGLDGRDKIALLLPRSWSAAALWTKRDFEESLGKSEALGIKIVIDEKVRLRGYHRVGDSRQDRAFLAIQRKGEAHPEAKQITEIRHARYPMAILTFPSTAPLSHYMQFMHCVVAGLGYLRRMNIGTRPGVALSQAIASELFEAGATHSPAWQSLKAPDPKKLAADLKKLDTARAIEYGELTYFGDMRYSEEGRALRVSLERAADRIFRSRLKMPVDIGEGPAMNHAYHEMIIGHGRCYSILLIARSPAHFALAHANPDYHVAQFLGTKMALERRHRHVATIPVDDLETLDRYFLEVASLL